MLRPRASCDVKPDHGGIPDCRQRVDGDRHGKPVTVRVEPVLPFGLTLSRSPPTVTERNRYCKRRLAGNRGNMPSEYAKTLGARLRAIRTQQGLSLHGVEEKSRGRW